MNNWFANQDTFEITYEGKRRHKGGPPYTRLTYEVLDYILATNRWGIGIKDIETDPEPNIFRDHYPIKVKGEIALNGFKKPMFGGPARTEPNAAEQEA